MQWTVRLEARTTQGEVKTTELVTEPPSLWWFSRALRGSCRHQNAPSQQVEAGAAVALPLQQFEAVDLAFGLAAAPGQGEGSANRRPVLLQPGGERLDGTDTARTRLGEPDVQVGCRCCGAYRLPDAALADKGGEPTREGGEEGRFLVGSVKNLGQVACSSGSDRPG